jgi:hypothetical protein
MLFPLTDISDLDLIISYLISAKVFPSLRSITAMLSLNTAIIIGMLPMLLWQVVIDFMNEKEFSGFYISTYFKIWPPLPKSRIIRTSSDEGEE